MAEIKKDIAMHQAVAEAFSQVSPSITTTIISPRGGVTIEIHVPLRQPGRSLESVQWVKGFPELHCPEGVEAEISTDAGELRLTDYRRRSYGSPALRISGEGFDLETKDEPVDIRLNGFGVVSYTPSPK